MTVLEDLQKLRADSQRFAEAQESAIKLIARHEEQISGERGLSAAINTLAEEVRSLRRALWTVGGSIVAASVAFGLSVLTLVH